MVSIVAANGLLIPKTSSRAITSPAGTADTMETLTRVDLDRDELQGVIAHEFSHILNGDMRLNIRLMGILHGILVIGLIGGVLLRVGSYSSMSRRRSKDDGGAKIDVADRTTRTRAHIAVESDHNGGPAVTFLQAAGNDADNAGVPTIPNG